MTSRRRANIHRDRHGRRSPPSGAGAAQGVGGQGRIVEPGEPARFSLIGRDPVRASQNPTEMLNGKLVHEWTWVEDGHHLTGQRAEPVRDDRCMLVREVVARQVHRVVLSDAEAGELALGQGAVDTLAGQLGGRPAGIDEPDAEPRVRAGSPVQQHLDGVRAKIRPDLVTEAIGPVPAGVGSGQPLPGSGRTLYPLPVVISESSARISPPDAGRWSINTTMSTRTLPTTSRAGRPNITGCGPGGGR